MNIEFLQALLQAWPATEAARLCDETGAVVAQSIPAQALADDVDFWSDTEVRHRTLHSFELQTRAAETPATAASQQAPRAAPEKPIEIQALSRGITHELRNPLAAIITAISLVQDDPETGDETRLLLSVVRKESKRMNRILTEFSNYVKPRPPQPIIFDAVAAAREVLNQVFLPALSDNGAPSHHPAYDITEMKNAPLRAASIEIEDALPEPLHAHADEGHFRDVLRQVMHNALEAMPGGGRLRIEAEHSGAKVLLTISDSGGGFSSEGLQRAFQPFFSSKSQSTGLGLSIARSTIEASGGRIWIENIPHSDSSLYPSTGNAAPDRQAHEFCCEDSGARVRIELPAAPQCHAADRPVA